MYRVEGSHFGASGLELGSRENEGHDCFHVLYLLLLSVLLKKCTIIIMRCLTRSGPQAVFGIGVPGGECGFERIRVPRRIPFSWFEKVLSRPRV